MIFIKQIYNFIFKTKNIDELQKKTDLITSSQILKCHFIVDKSGKIKVFFDWPININDSNLEEISYNSSYFLFLLNNGLLKEEILGALKNSHDPVDAIMYQNILFNSRLIELEARSMIDSKKISEPLIKPSAVFSRKQ